VSLVLRGPYGHRQVDAIIDTGFLAVLSVPEEISLRLGLLARGIRPVMLADGALRMSRVFLIEIEWLGGPTSVEALTSNCGEVLIGAELLRGSEVVIDYGPLKTVEIR
jgi:clan AA aspartic protease